MAPKPILMMADDSGSRVYVYRMPEQGKRLEIIFDDGEFCVVELTLEECRKIITALTA